MRFLVDECTGPRVAAWLREAAHEVFSVYEEARGLDDETILPDADTEPGIPTKDHRRLKWCSCSTDQ